MRDDGKGIDAAVLSAQRREGHYGLPGMRERATLIGGKLTIWSEVDAGAEVELRVPASIVYATARRRSWLSQAFAAKARGSRRSVMSADASRIRILGLTTIRSCAKTAENS